MSLVHDTAKMLAVGLANGSTLPNVLCPVCDGGRSHDRTFSVSRLNNGTIAFNCFRDQCTVNGGRISEEGYSVARPATTKQVRKLKPYMGGTWCPSMEDFDFFEQRFHLSGRTVDRGVMTTERGEYAFPIFGADYKRRGYVIRQPVWKGFPQPPMEGRPGCPKALTYLEVDAEPISFYLDTGLQHVESSPLIIVEDQVSAMRCMSDGLRAVALLGTHLNMHRVREIASVSKDVIIALDEDATATAFGMAQTWGLAFNSCRIAILDQDIKDMPRNEVLGALGL